MINNPSLYQKGLAQFYKMYSQDAGKALIHMGAAGTALSSAAQVGMIATNKEMKSKEKSFLASQEITDGIINVGLLYTLSKAIKKISDNLVEDGSISLSKTNALIDRFNTCQLNSNQVLERIAKNYINSVKNSNTINPTTKQEILNKIGQNTTLFYEKIISDLENAEKATKPSGLAAIANKTHSKASNKELLKAVKEAQKEFLSFKNGIGVIAAVGASVLASNVIAPFYRNLIANKVQEVKKQYEPITIKLPTNVLNTATKNKAVMA